MKAETEKKLIDIPKLWLPMLREARESAKWINWVARDEFYPVERLERLLRYGLKIIPAECLLIEPDEVIKRKQQEILSIESEIYLIKKRIGRI